MSIYPRQGKEAAVFPPVFPTDFTRQGLGEQTAERFAELGGGSSCKSILILVFSLNVGPPQRGDSSTNADLQHRDGSGAGAKHRESRES